MCMGALTTRAIAVDASAHRWLRAHSTTALRLSLGAVFLGFGVLKYFPGVSPAADLAVTTTRILTLGLVPDPLALVGVASLECVIGICLLAGGRLLGVAVVLLVPELAGILSPLVVLHGRLFAGPHHAPTLEAQYVLKDVILVAATMVIATTLRGAALRLPATAAVSTSQKLAIVLAGLREEATVPQLCAEHGIAAADYYRWRNDVLAAVGTVTTIQQSLRDLDEVPQVLGTLPVTRP